TILERRQGILQGRTGRIMGSGIFVSLVVTGRALGVGRGLVNRRHDGAGRWVGVYARVYGFGSEFHSRFNRINAVQVTGYVAKFKMAGRKEIREESGNIIRL
ncbi:MAG: hypothetical protein JWQ14_3520, partial [Adhaeribacter sp.]|nr:hypothetical protein [Adhaeribacter sp.]